MYHVIKLSLLVCYLCFNSIDFNDKIKSLGVKTLGFVIMRLYTQNTLPNRAYPKVAKTFYRIKLFHLDLEQHSYVATIIFSKELHASFKSSERRIAVVYVGLKKKKKSPCSRSSLLHMDCAMVQCLQRLQDIPEGTSTYTEIAPRSELK